MKVLPTNEVESKINCMVYKTYDLSEEDINFVN